MLSIKMLAFLRNIPVISTSVRGEIFSIEKDFSSCLVEMTVPAKLGNIIFSAFLLFATLSGFSQNVDRVISLAPSVTENIYLVGAQDKLVGCTSYCTQAVADGIEQVGSTIDVNIEKILTLKPDLVITMLMTKTQDIEAMHKLGIKVEVIPSPKNFEEICDQTMHIANLLGKKEKAKKITRTTNSRLTA